MRIRVGSRVFLGHGVVRGLVSSFPLLGRVRKFMGLGCLVGWSWYLVVLVFVPLVLAYSLGCLLGLRNVLCLVFGRVVLWFVLLLGSLRLLGRTGGWFPLLGRLLGGIVACPLCTLPVLFPPPYLLQQPTTVGPLKPYNGEDVLYPLVK